MHLPGICTIVIFTLDLDVQIIELQKSIVKDGMEKGKETSKKGHYPMKTSIQKNLIAFNT